MFCESREAAEQVKARLTGWLAERGLAFNEDKTRVVHLNDGLDFLGYVEHTVMPRLTSGDWWPGDCVGGPRHFRGLFRAV